MTTGGQNKVFNPYFKVKRRARGRPLKLKGRPNARILNQIDGCESDQWDKRLNTLITEHPLIIDRIIRLKGPSTFRCEPNAWAAQYLFNQGARLSDDRIDWQFLTPIARLEINDCVLARNTIQVDE